MCPQQYFCEYVLGWRGSSGLKADKGTIVHKCLEVLALAKKAKQEGKKYFVDDIAGKVWTSYFDVNEIVDTVYHYYSRAFSHHNWIPKDFKDCKDWTWKALQHNDGMFDPRKLDIVDAEPHFDFEIDEPWADYEYDFEGEKVTGKLAMKGTIDLIVDSGDGVYEIIDWKTGRRLDWATGQEKTYAKLQVDPQLRIYHYAASKLYPEAKQIIVTIYFINDGGPFTICFGPEDIAKTKEVVRKKFEEIKHTRIPRLNKSWKCRKLCHQGKTTFEGTHIEPLMKGNGYYMSKCEQVHHETKHHGIGWVSENMLKEGHNVTKYKAPGSIE
jgi:hypothetical protein